MDFGYSTSSCPRLSHSIFSASVLGSIAQHHNWLLPLLVTGFFQNINSPNITYSIFHTMASMFMYLEPSRVPTESVIMRGLFSQSLSPFLTRYFH